MTSKPSSIGPWILHPWLATAIPLVLLLVGNVGEAGLSDSFRMLVLLELTTTLVFLAAARALGSRHSGALFTSLAIVTVFAYQGVESATRKILPLAAGDAVFWILLVAHGVVFAALGWALRSTPVKPSTTRLLNVVIGALLAMNIAQWLWMSLPAGGLAQPGVVQASSDPIGPLTPAPDPPDLYVLLLDAYARHDALAELYGLDNSGFVSDLEDMGFTVSPEASSNYPITRLIVPSLLRANYLDDLAAEVGPDSVAVRPLINETWRAPTVRALKQAGYTTVYLGSEVPYTHIPADVMRIQTPGAWEPTDYEWVALEMTLLPDLFIRMSHPWARTSIHRRRVLGDFEALRDEARTDRGPKFVFAHLFAPHAPFAFGANGEVVAGDLDHYITYTPEQQRRIMRQYRDQVTYTNGLVIEALREIFDNADPDPIVYVFGDHGLRLFMGESPQTTCLRDAFEILSAVHLPDDTEVPADLTPVNALRLIFDSQFGTELGLLDNRAYFVEKDRIYDFIEVTGKTSSCTIPVPPAPGPTR